MMYKALFTDEFLSHFRLDDNGKTLVLTDKTWTTRAVRLEEVKPGEWIKNNNDTYSCSLCLNCSCKKTKFCPNCGADMQERKKVNE